MGNQRFGRKRGMKRRVEQKPFTKNQNMMKKKNGRFGREEKLNRSPSPSVSDDSGEENSEIEEVEAQKEQEEEEVLNYKEPTMYDSLLESLRTKREEYNSDSEENEDDVEQAHGASGDENEGSDSEASRLSEPGASLNGGGLGNPVGQVGGTETDDDDSEASGSDEEQELRVNGQPTKGACASTSSFHSHLDHKLSKEEVDMLQKKKWTCKWVVAMSNCKWRGTGECFLKELDGFLFHGLKPALYKHWLGIYEKSGGSDFASSKQILFFSLCNSYRDILHHNKKPFYLKGLEEDSSTMDAYVMHSVLIILPLASVAFRVVKRLIDLTPPKYKKIGEAEMFKEKNVDYLSSIEVLIVDHADVILMQNWSHVNTIVEQLNRIPCEQHGTDIMRIRQWYLDGQAPFYRQSIILSSHINPDINGLFNHHCLNHEGKVKLASEYKGVLPKVVLQIRQIYERFDAKTAEDADDARFDYFTKKVFPKIKDSIQGGIMLFISSYFEFIRVRNFLKSQEASCCLLGE